MVFSKSLNKPITFVDIFLSWKIWAKERKMARKLVRKSKISRFGDNQVDEDQKNTSILNDSPRGSNTLQIKPQVSKVVHRTDSTLAIKISVFSCYNVASIAGR